MPGKKPAIPTGDDELQEDFLLIHELRKLIEIGIRDVRNSAIFHPLTAPVAPLIPLPETGRMNRRVRFPGGKNKNVNDVLAAGID